MDFRKRICRVVLLYFLIVGTQSTATAQTEPLQISGIYPHLAFYNQGNECGTGAVVPWAGRLWVVTYSPHSPNGSTDQLYEISEDLQMISREESIGGTPANRMIHQESSQLFIGPHAIDPIRRVRTMSYIDMPGRHTGTARHLVDPERKVYYGTMEEGFYEVDVQNLDAQMLYPDMNPRFEFEGVDSTSPPLPASLEGAHGKGLFSGQGVLVYSNNGEKGEEAMRSFDTESGSLSEWDGSSWKLIRRNQFVEVTGPGGIYGNPKPATDPIWTTGWDHKSLLVGVRSPTEWSFYRLPKASHSYDGAHGWNTEWPRIRYVGNLRDPEYLMTMHGMFWDFPGTFSTAHSAGIRPRSAYLKVIGDFARWNDKLVFGCDDSAKKEFLNTRKQKGNIGGPGQSNSNLWFTDLSTPDNLGPGNATGSVWLNEEVESNTYSEPFLFAGWPHRTLWLAHDLAESVTFTLEIDKLGTGGWEILQTIDIGEGHPMAIEFSSADQGEWIRIKASRSASITASFTYRTLDERNVQSNLIFDGLAPVAGQSSIGGLLYGLGDDRRALGMVAHKFDGENGPEVLGYYELNEQLELLAKKDDTTQSYIESKFKIPKNVVSVEDASVLIIDDKGRRWRLPRGADANTGLTDEGLLRICREVATERDLLNCHGTFYELPAENADGFAKVRPIASHEFRIHDYASYRGLLVITGIQPEAAAAEHLIRSSDGKAAVWVGVIDDLWELGKPTGRGGPWLSSAVVAEIPSDPYLIGFYDQKKLELSHEKNSAVSFRIEVDPTGSGIWMPYEEVTVEPDSIFTLEFSDAFDARWVRFVPSENCIATAILEYH